MRVIFVLIKRRRRNVGGISKLGDGFGKKGAELEKENDTVLFK